MKVRRAPCPEFPHGLFKIGSCGNCARKLSQKPRVPNKVLSCFRGQSGTLSALHKKIRDSLALGALGFLSEQAVGIYRCDEVHREKKLIVEINGDYVHANPRKYKHSDWVVLEWDKYRARHKWKLDADRIRYLEARGYKVLVVWESDPLPEVREALAALLG